MRRSGQRNPGSSDETRLLVIGYGNSLRRDDGVGPAVAARVRQWRRPGVGALACHQLTPEMAQEIAAADMVLFVDAAKSSASQIVQEKLIQPSAAEELRPHTSDPGALLALAGALYGKCPRAQLITIPALDFGFGERFSACAQRGVTTALRLIARHLAALES